MFLRRWRIPEPYRAWIDDLMAEQKGQGYRWYAFDNKESAAGRRILEASPEEQRGFVLAAAEWLNLYHRKQSAAFYETWAVRQTMLTVLRRRLPFDHDDVCRLLDWSIRQPYTLVRGTPQMIKVLQDLPEGARAHPRSPQTGSPNSLDVSKKATAQKRRAAGQRGSRELGGFRARPTRLVPGEAWSDAAISDIEAMEGEERAAWVALLQHCTKARGAKPTQKWSTKAESVLEKIGRPAFERSVVRWFLPGGEAAHQARRAGVPVAAGPQPAHAGRERGYPQGARLAVRASENAEVARALGALALSAYRKVPQMGPRCVRLGNACVWALGTMPDAGGVGQLAMLRARVKFGTAQKGIEKALDTAAGRAGMPLQEIEEISVPAYGLQEVGVRRAQFGEFGVELVVTGTSNTELRWIKPDGKRQKSVPKAVKEHSAEELKEIKAAASRPAEDAAGPARQDREPVSGAEDLDPQGLARALSRPSCGRHACATLDLEVHKPRNAQEPASSTKAGSWVVTATSWNGWTTRPTCGCGTPCRRTRTRSWPGGTGSPNWSYASPSSRRTGKSTCSPTRSVPRGPTPIASPPTSSSSTSSTPCARRGGGRTS